jgi:hypothetical protein
MDPKVRSMKTKSNPRVETNEVKYAADEFR